MTSVLIPTKGRIEKLRKCVNSISDRHKVLILSADDKDSLRSIKADVYYDKYMTPVDACNYLARIADVGSHLAPSGDDVEYCKDAISIAEEMLINKFNGDGIISFNVINMSCNDDAFMLVGRKFYDTVLNGKLFYDGYKHFFADTELGGIAKSLNKFAICQDAKIINYHPSAGYPADETHYYRRVEKLAHDKQVYDSRVLHRQVC